MDLMLPNSDVMRLRNEDQYLFNARERIIHTICRMSSSEGVVTLVRLFVLYEIVQIKVPRNLVLRPFCLFISNPDFLDVLT